VAVGGPGTGKTHIATALGIQAVEHHRKKVRFFATVDLVNALEREKAMNKAGQLAERLLRLFAQQKNRFGMFIRTIGLARAEAKLTLCNLAYNFNRLVFHERRQSMG